QRDLLEAKLPVAPEGGEEEVTERGGEAPEVAAEDVRSRQAEELLRSTVHPGHVSARVDGDRAVLEMGEDLLDEAVLGPDGAEERDVLDRHGDLTGQREEPLEILGAVRLTVDARAQGEDADELRLDPERHGHLASEGLELAERVEPLGLAGELLANGEPPFAPEPRRETVVGFQMEERDELGIEPPLAADLVTAVLVEEEERRPRRPDQLDDGVEEEADDAI